MVEFMLPTIEAARVRGWKIYGAYSRWATRMAMAHTGLFDEYVDFFASWDWAYKVLTVPLADEIFESVKPNALLIDLCGSGASGGAWLEEAFRRKMPAVEIRGPQQRVWWYGQKSREGTLRFLEKLRQFGYGRIPHPCIEDTNVVQRVGSHCCEYVVAHSEPATTKRRLGAPPDKRIIVLWSNWSKGGYAKITNEDLEEWSAKAQENDAVLVFSIHPVLVYSQWELEEITFPEDVILTANFPCSLWGHEVKWIPTLDVLYACDFGIFQFGNALIAVHHALGRPAWLRCTGTARGNPKTREALPIEEPINELNDASLSWRASDSLDKLFKGELGQKGTFEQCVNWCEQSHFRVGGGAADRIVDLLEGLSEFG